MHKVTVLNDLAQERGQALSQMALAWVLQRATSVIIGASRLRQIAENCKTIENTAFSKEELENIEQILNG